MTLDEIDNLRVDAVSEGVESVNWSSLQAGGSFGYEVYEAVECDKCRDVLVLGLGEGGALHTEIDPDGVLPDCEIASHHGGLGPCEDCLDSTGEDGIGVCMCQDAPCDGYVPEVSGPAINYVYPCKLRDLPDAAKKIAHLPLCVIEFPGGATGFALTGGGMDFTWEICAAYVACGFLPPAQFDLPKMSGLSMDGWHRDVWYAMKRSIQVQQNWLNNSLEKLDVLKKWIEDQDAKSKAKNAAREAT